jgi:uncharacterized phage-associated protein
MTQPSSSRLTFNRYSIIISGGTAMAYDANVIAKYVIKIAHDHGDDVTPLKLQKLLYYIQGCYLAVCGRPAFDENILAWKHGPVIYSVYAAYRNFKGSTIDRPNSIPDISDIDKEIISEIYKKYRGYSAAQLVDKTHKEAPWVNSDTNDVITMDSIQDYFSRFVFVKEKLFGDMPVVDKLPTDEYDPSEDADYSEWLKANGKAV